MKKPLWLVPVLAVLVVAGGFGAWWWMHAQPTNQNDQALIGSEDLEIKAIERRTSDEGYPLPDRVILKSGRVIHDLAHKTEFEGRLRGPGGVPVLLFSGYECESCDALPSLFVHSLAANQTEQLPLPGEWTAGETNATGKPDFRAKVFMGKCAADDDDSMVIITQSAAPNGDWRPEHAVRLLITAEGALRYEVLEKGFTSAGAGCRAFAPKSPR